MRLREPKCDHCIYFIEGDTKDMCRAFPEGIPSEVMFADDDSECALGIKFKEIDN